MNDTVTHTNGVAKLPKLPKLPEADTKGSETTLSVEANDAVKAMVVIDDRIRHGENDELGRGVLVESRWRLFEAAGGKERDFTKHTAEKTGLSRAVVQRLHRIGRLPSDVRSVLFGTKVADRQDLLVELATRIEVNPTMLEEAVAFARELVENPPKYGPRTLKRGVPVERAANDIVLHDQRLEIAIFEGMPLAMGFPDGLPRIQDLELGRRLGYGRPRDIRHVVKELIASGHLTLAELRGGAPRPVTSASNEHWYTEEQALFITTQSGTPVARGITKQVIRAFIEARRSIINVNVVSRLQAIDLQLHGFSKSIDDRLAAIEKRGFGTRGLLLIPQVDPEEAGYSMESMNRHLIEKGYNISAVDTAIRSIAGHLRIIGDTDYGFWNAHNDTVVRGTPLGESWRFNDSGTAAIQPYAQLYVELKAKYEEAGEPAPRETALNETLDKVTPRGTGKYENLTRTRAQRPPPFTNIRGPVQAPVDLNSIILVSAGMNKIQVIKAIREITGLGLREAKDLAEAPKPALVKGLLSKEQAESGANKLRDAGASVELKTV